MSDVRWDGLGAWNARLKHLETIMPDVAYDVAERTAVIVAGKARTFTPLGPAANGHARNTIDSRGSTVSGGDRTHPYFGWLDFGGAVGRRNSIKRPFLKGGRIIFAAYRADRPFVEERMEDAVERAVRRAGLR